MGWRRYRNVMRSLQFLQPVQRDRSSSVPVTRTESEQSIAEYLHMQFYFKEFVLDILSERPNLSRRIVQALQHKPTEIFRIWEKSVKQERERERRRNSIK